MPAFPRRQPPRDTNRAGESYAATLLSTLLDHGWDAASGVIDDDLIRTAACGHRPAAATRARPGRLRLSQDAEIDAALAHGLRRADIDQASVGRSRSRQDRFDDLAMDVGQPALNSIVIVCQSFVIDAQQVQHRRMEVGPGRRPPRRPSSRSRRSSRGRCRA